MSDWKTITIKKEHDVFKINASISGSDVNFNPDDNFINLRMHTSYDHHSFVRSGRWPKAEDVTSVTILVAEGQKIGFRAVSQYYIEPICILSVCPESKKEPTQLNYQQKIIFGPPGTGKSYSVDAIANDLGIGGCPDRRIQTVFHPEYTYGDFIAKLMPITVKIEEESKVEYRVVAGHFIKALAQALKETEQNVLLQIDEINRGNCAAIFGDIFQLLDRDSEGNSSYSIQLSELALSALAQEIVGKNNNGIYDEATLKDVISKHTKGVKIPKNLSIIATMNTSDESVYFMDSAFKRRWQFQYISADTYCFDKDNKPVINLPSEDSKITQQANANITCCNTNDLKWDCLRRSINLFMIANAKTIRGIEDKQIGLWFVKATGTEISEADITFKLMHYLWDNVFARDKKPLRDLLTVETTEKGTDDKPIFRSRTEAELATFGQFVKLKDEFIQKVLEKCPCEKPACKAADQTS